MGEWFSRRSAKPETRVRSSLRALIPTSWKPPAPPETAPGNERRATLSIAGSLPGQPSRDLDQRLEPIDHRLYIAAAGRKHEP